MWQLIKSEKVVDNKWLSVRKEHVVLPHGQVIDDFFSVDIADCSAIVAIDTEGNVILKREYKYPPNEELLEIPAGMFEPTETDSLAVAKRELLEETGYVSDDWTFFGPTVECSSKLTNRMHIYMALNCRKVAEQQLDETEELEVVVMPLKQAIDLVMENKICCNSSAHAILRAARILGV